MFPGFHGSPSGALRPLGRVHWGRAAAAHDAAEPGEVSGGASAANGEEKGEGQGQVDPAPWLHMVEKLKPQPTRILT